MRASRRQQLRPQGALTYHAWVADQDTKVLSSDGTGAFYLERPLKAGRLEADWNYKLQLGNKSGGSGGITILTISRQWASPLLLDPFAVYLLLQSRANGACMQSCQGLY